MRYIIAAPRKKMTHMRRISKKTGGLKINLKKTRQLKIYNLYIKISIDINYYFFIIFLRRKHDYI